MLKLRRLTQISSSEFELFWEDGHTSRLSTSRLRDACPCAGCKGESVLLRSYVPEPPDLNTPGRYGVVSVEQVGGYAVKFTWADGHNTGIYPHELLDSLCRSEKV